MSKAINNQPIAIGCGEESITLFVRVTPDRDGLEVYIDHIRAAEAQAKKKAASILKWLARRDIRGAVDDHVDIDVTGSHFTNIQVGVTLQKREDMNLREVLMENDTYDRMLHYDENDFWEGH